MSLDGSSRRYEDVMMHLVFSDQATGSFLKDCIILPINAVDCVDRCNVYGDYCRAHKDRPVRDAAIVFNLRLKCCFETFSLSAHVYCMSQKRTDDQAVKLPMGTMPVFLPFGQALPR
jgi:hypothetical protein